MGNNRVDALFAAKWPEDVAQRGFVPVPKCLITCMGDLGLSPQEVSVLINIIERCWFAGDKAWPSVDYLATNIGRGNSTTRGITSSLAKKGFLDKEQRYNTSSLYDLEPLAKKLEEHMKHCRHSARKLAPDSQIPSGQDRQNLSDYIEPELIRTTYIQPSIDKDSYLKNDSHIESSEDIQLIYDCYIKEFDKNPLYYKLTAKRISKIKERLNDAGSEMLTKAIENAVLSDFYMGNNDRGWTIDLDWIISSYENTEKALNQNPSKSPEEHRLEKVRKARREAQLQAIENAELQRN